MRGFKRHLAHIICGFAHIITGTLGVVSLGFFVKYPPIEVAEFFVKRGWI